jgi:hypothetical protein
VNSETEHKLYAHDAGRAERELALHWENWPSSVAVQDALRIATLATDSAGFCNAALVWAGLPTHLDRVKLTCTVSSAWPGLARFIDPQNMPIDGLEVLNLRWRTMTNLSKLLTDEIYFV